MENFETIDFIDEKDKTMNSIKGFLEGIEIEKSIIRFNKPDIVINFDKRIITSCNTAIGGFIDGLTTNESFLNLKLKDKNRTIMKLEDIEREKTKRHLVLNTLIGDMFVEERKVYSEWKMFKQNYREETIHYNHLFDLFVMDEGSSTTHTVTDIGMNSKRIIFLSPPLRSIKGRIVIKCDRKLFYQTTYNEIKNEINIDEKEINSLKEDDLRIDEEIKIYSDKIKEYNQNIFEYSNLKEFIDKNTFLTKNNISFYERFINENDIEITKLISPNNEVKYNNI